MNDMPDVIWVQRNNRDKFDRISDYTANGESTTKIDIEYLRKSHVEREYVTKSEHDEVKNERDELRKGYALAADVTGYDGDWFDAAPIRDLISIKAESVPRELVEQLIEATEELNALIPRADQMIYDDDFKSFYSVIKSIREHGK